MSEEIEPVFPCSTCNRNFIRSSLEKHELACEKLQKMHRKAFDSGKQRASGSDIPLKDIRKAQKEKEKYGGSFPRPETKWRERHKDFIGAISNSKQIKDSSKCKITPSHAAKNLDYLQCPHCKRTFNPHAAERHITFCKNKNEQKNLCSVSLKRTPSTTLKKLPPSAQSNQSANKNLAKKDTTLNSKLNNLSLNRRDSSQSQNKLLNKKKNNNTLGQNSSATCKTNIKS